MAEGAPAARPGLSFRPFGGHGFASARAARAGRRKRATSRPVGRTIRGALERGRATGRLTDFVDEFTEGLTTGELKRLFQRDAAQAYRVLTREHDASEEPKGRVRRWFFRARAVFLGLSYKLTPARRILFAVSILAGILGFLRFQIVADEGRFQADFSPLWFTISIAGLTFLLALELVDRVLVRDELEVARQLQRDMLPSAAPEIPGYRIAHSYRTANEIGGDYYDFLSLADGRIGLVVGDASGHGMAAGLLMAIANAALKAALEVDPAPQKVAGLLNRVLCRTGDKRAFMSLFYGLLAPATGKLEYVCVGHPFPLLRRAKGEVIELGRGGFPLGIRDTLEIAPMGEEIASGDLLVLYSDGLPEAVNAAGNAFGYDRLKELLKTGGDPQAVHARFLRALDTHLAGEALKDDVSLVVVART